MEMKLNDVILFTFKLVTSVLLFSRERELGTNAEAVPKRRRMKDDRVIKFFIVFGFVLLMNGK